LRGLLLTQREGRGKDIGKQGKERKKGNRKEGKGEYGPTSMGLGWKREEKGNERGRGRE